MSSDSHKEARGFHSRVGRMPSNEALVSRSEVKRARLHDASTTSAPESGQGMRGGKKSQASS